MRWDGFRARADVTIFRGSSSAFSTSIGDGTLICGGARENDRHPKFLHHVTGIIFAISGHSVFWPDIWFIKKSSGGLFLVNLRGDRHLAVEVKQSINSVDAAQPASETPTLQCDDRTASNGHCQRASASVLDKSSGTRAATRMMRTPKPNESQNFRDKPSVTQCRQFPGKHNNAKAAFTLFNK
ncbi:hypothetical protein GGX14DRAFT_401095 [Mycena pura]|uniref:Uncharacterized protein n=1 Tax=Mycena pura TaxID=153505 RepID=A0AAD6V1I5_9AGAR|nr:hypothetical protein GGX14DRAFT_401095 [Mycena pura]